MFAGVNASGAYIVVSSNEYYQQNSQSYGSRYSRMDQVKFVEDGL